MVVDIRRLLASSLGLWIVLAVVFLTVLFAPWKKLEHHINLQFGIDIAGGVYTTLGVKTDEAIAYELQSTVQSALAGLKRSGEKIEPTATKFDAEKLIYTITCANMDQVIKLQEAIERSYGRNTHDLVFNSAHEELTVQFSEGKKADIRKQAVQNNKEVLQMRLNQGGQEEIPVYISGKDRIVVELPDTKSIAEAKQKIGKPAMLEFRIVEQSAASKEDLLDKFDGQLPEGMEILPGKRGSREMGYYLVPTYTEVTGRDLITARVQSSAEGVAVAFKFNVEGGKKFYDLTSQNVTRTLAAILDHEVVSAATINCAISNEGIITGHFSMKEGKELAALLRSGAFTAPVTFEEERVIGPNLGADAIRGGLLACIIGLALLLAFSVLYYRVSGLIAYGVLLYNLLLLLFIFSVIKAVLTLPGIAGLALTVGMAIDSSILIFERTKELLRQGATITHAVHQGFFSSLATILDANITALIVGIILYNFGTGPIRGFAITMIIGIFTTLISGLLVLRSIFEYRLARGVQKLSI